MADILSKISIVSFALAAVFFALAVLFWFKFGIPTIIGDLSGRTAKKSIAKMRNKNEKTGKKIFRPSSVNIERGKVTDIMKDSEKLNKDSVKRIEEIPETNILKENQLDNLNMDMTEVLNANEETCILSEKEIELEEFEDNATTLLNDNTINYISQLKQDIDFKIIDEVVIIHTEEVI